MTQLIEYKNNLSTKQSPTEILTPAFSDLSEVLQMAIVDYIMNLNNTSKQVSQSFNDLETDNLDLNTQLQSDRKNLFQKTGKLIRQIETGYMRKDFQKPFISPNIISISENEQYTPSQLLKDETARKLTSNSIQAKIQSRILNRSSNPEKIIYSFVHQLAMIELHLAELEYNPNGEFLKKITLDNYLDIKNLEKKVNLDTYLKTVFDVLSYYYLSNDNGLKELTIY